MRFAGFLTTSVLIGLLTACAETVVVGDYCDVYTVLGPLSKRSAVSLVESDPRAADAIIQNEANALPCRKRGAP